MLMLKLFILKKSLRLRSTTLFPFLPPKNRSLQVIKRTPRQKGS